jgi:DNA polymerase V
MREYMTRGGLRQGAGRKKNSGIYKEETRPVRLPIRYIEQVKNFLAQLCNQEMPKLGTGIDSVQGASEYENTQGFPLFASLVSAGFPSPADDHLENKLDLNEHLVSHPASTFFVRVSGNSMINAGINDKDILVVDRSLDAKHNDVVIAVLNGELTVKRLQRSASSVSLKPENPDYPLIHISPDMEFSLWGVVTSVIHQFK